MPERAARIHGEIVEAITDRAVCLECIAAKVGGPIGAVDDALVSIERVIQLSVMPRSRCADCGATRVTFAIYDRPARRTGPAGGRSNLTQ